jgi:hypothetical protein
MKTIHRMKGRVIVLAWVLALVSAGTPRCFGSDNPGAMVVDTVLVRPVCLVATIIGSAFFVISLPVTVPSKSVHHAAQSLVVKPAQATFTRPLGDLENLTEY